MSDFNLHVHIPNEFHIQVNTPQLEELREDFRQWFIHLTAILTRVGARMSEAADQLTAAVQSVQTGFDTLNTTLQTEMQEIANALSSASTDQALHDAASDAVSRLSVLATSISDMNTQIQGIIP